MSDAGRLLVKRARRGEPAVEARAEVGQLVIAGWTGRDRQATEAHIRELAELGIARPRTMPIFYRVAASLLTTAPVIETIGTASSGEVEPVLFALEDGLWVGVGSDHTDRKFEAVGVTLSKQLCAKPIGATLWPFAELAEHWDRLVLRCYALSAGGRRLYQEGPAGSLRRPEELIALYAGGAKLSPGTVMFSGTIPVKGTIGGAEAFELEIEDAVLQRRLTHRYAVHTLPIEG